tara:strand:- start:230 stop:556 length:327 start_codon:yes stop_codon:yes gene_type:complete
MASLEWELISIETLVSAAITLAADLRIDAVREIPDDTLMVPLSFESMEERDAFASPWSVSVAAPYGSGRSMRETGWVTDEPSTYKVPERAVRRSESLTDNCPKPSTER